MDGIMPDKSKEEMLQDTVDALTDLEQTLARAASLAGRALRSADQTARAYNATNPKVRACELGDADGFMGLAMANIGEALRGVKNAHCLYLDYAANRGEEVPAPRIGGR